MTGLQRSIRQAEKSFPDGILSRYKVGRLVVSQGQKVFSNGEIVINREGKLGIKYPHQQCFSSHNAFS